jgi:hypothetical protein
MLLGFAGPKGCGKDTAADLCSIKISIAEPIKTICSIVFKHVLFDDEHKNTLMYVATTDKHIHTLIGCLNKYDELTKIQENNIRIILTDKVFTSTREILQFIGKNVVKFINPDFWTNILVKRITEAAPVATIAVSDVRFPDERALIKNMGGKLILIKRPGLISDSTSKHISENSFGSDEEYDHIVNNSGNISHLHIEIQKILVYVNETLQSKQ